MRADLDGKNVTTLVPAGGTFTPKQMKLDVAGGKMYWSDREGMRVMRANLDGSSVEALVTTGTTDQDRMDNSRWCVGIALDLAGGWFYWSQKGPANGGVGTLRRAHLAMPDGQTSATRTDIFAWYFKHHHSMLDGYSMILAMTDPLSSDPVERDRPLFFSIPPRASPKPPPASASVEAGEPE